MIVMKILWLAIVVAYTVKSTTATLLVVRLAENTRLFPRLFLLLVTKINLKPRAKPTLFSVTGKSCIPTKLIRGSTLRGHFVNN